jgi:hypothetical protein
MVQDVLVMESLAGGIAPEGWSLAAIARRVAIVATHNAPVHFPIKVLRSLPYGLQEEGSLSSQQPVSAERRSIGGAKAACKGIRGHRMRAYLDF